MREDIFAVPEKMKAPAIEADTKKNSELNVA